jgi:hypothetical protein
MWQNLPAWFCPSFVMFFAEPARAFANLRTALKPSGRLAFALGCAESPASAMT